MLATRADSPSLSDARAAAVTGPSAFALARISATVRAGIEASADRASSAIATAAAYPSES